MLVASTATPAGEHCPTARVVGGPPVIETFITVPAPEFVQ